MSIIRLVMVIGQLVTRGTNYLLTLEFEAAAIAIRQELTLLPRMYWLLGFEGPVLELLVINFHC